ncbi:hypothetical protein L218DRAFT_944231 [Marasmius fiardii PR-910]|nr:hypothetical protein L218DRAFT_944231 [Marasmius fiardii PR-910]
MRLQSLFYLSLSLAASTGLVSAAPATAGQAVTIQRFPLKPGSDTLSKLTAATAQFKGWSKNRIEHAFVGVVDGTAEQVFVWRSPEDSVCDTATPFKAYSSSGGVSSRGTAVANDKTTLLRALTSPATETIVTSILPQVSVNQVENDLNILWTDIQTTGLGIGGTDGVSSSKGTRTILVINGWSSVDAVGKWVAQQSPDVAAAFTRVTQQSFAVGTVPLYKRLTEV